MAMRSRSDPQAVEWGGHLLSATPDGAGVARVRALRSVPVEGWRSSREIGVPARGRYFGPAIRTCWTPFLSVTEGERHF